MNSVPAALGLINKQIPRIKLAGTYLAIIMGMSILFSYTIYNLSDRELTGQRQVAIPQDLRLSLMDEFDHLREARLEESRTNLRQRLLFFNLITLLFGSILSYTLALRALQPIEEAMDAQNRFTSDASHEIRTPLTAMRSEIEVTLRDKNLSIKDAKQTLKSSLEEVTKLESLTNGLLQLAKYENTPLIKQKILLCDLVEDALSQVQPALHKKKITIVTRVSKKLYISAEPLSLRQTIVILLDNAVKYSPKASTITVAAKSSRSAHIISIKDTGAGIDKQDLPNIFDRFYRSDKSRTKQQQASGYGLGLSIAKQITDAHGGNITITSGKAGTIASIHLPKK